MVRQKAKALASRKGILVTHPREKPGKSLHGQTVDLIKDFCHSDSRSRAMPGLKGYISVKDVSGQKVHIPKRLVLNNLNKIYRYFKGKYHNVRVEFSKFCELGPRNLWFVSHSNLLLLGKLSNLPLNKQTKKPVGNLLRLQIRRSYYF